MTARPARRSWVPDAGGSGFDLDHLPYGVVRRDGEPRPAVRVGGHALDLRVCAPLLPQGEWTDGGTLDALLAAGPRLWRDTRAALIDLLDADTVSRPPGDALVPLDQLPPPVMPFTVGDFVDFYSSIHHASNVGRIFRPQSPPLLDNWRHLPVGYHGRASTVVVSGTDVVRPVGQRRPAGSTSAPPVGPTQQLDIELEVGFVTGGPANPLGTRVSTAQAADRIFGIMLLNDWSARDIQAWEYQPLGPFLGKSFATSIAAWVTPLDALAAARVCPPVQDPLVSSYLQVHGEWAFDLSLEVALTPADGTGEAVISRVSLADMYWTMPQQLAHVSVNGAVVRPGDLFGSGTVSGPERGTEGSLLEMTIGGTEPLMVAGQHRTYLKDGDRITLRGHCTGGSGALLRLADCTGTVRSALRSVREGRQ
ncbi:MAG: fumarylacetoacetase [Euzebya sp.]